MSEPQRRNQMRGFEALGKARMLLDEAKRDGRYPAGVIDISRPDHRRNGKVAFALAYDAHLQKMINTDNLVGMIDDKTTEQRLAEMLLEAM